MLCIQDTTEINFTKHIVGLGKDAPDIGPVTNAAKGNAGFFCHPILVIDALQGLPFGIAGAEIWNRTWDTTDKHERHYQQLPIEQKESYRWVKLANYTKQLLTKPSMLTIIADREADIFAEFVLVPDEHTHLLIRSSMNRNLAGGDKLYEKLSAQIKQLDYDLPLQKAKKRSARTAKMELRYVEVELKRPKTLSKKDYPETTKVWAIEVREQAESVPKGEQPILWRLLTTHKIDSAEQAMQCVEWYTKRWYIEELFRVIKSKGFELESSQLRSGKALKKQTAMAQQVALAIMLLKLAFDKGDTETDASLVFDEEEIKYIDILLKVKIEGKTEKQKNPFPARSLAWCAWAIARLGAWSGYKSHGKPGYITMKEGYETFLTHIDAIKIMRDV